LIGDDWAEDHHDIEIEDETGRRLAKARLPEGLEGITRFMRLSPSTPRRPGRSCRRRTSRAG
jgi:hypothetical protein